MIIKAFEPTSCENHLSMKYVSMIILLQFSITEKNIDLLLRMQLCLSFGSI